MNRTSTLIARLADHVEQGTARHESLSRALAALDAQIERLVLEHERLVVLVSEISKAAKDNGGER